MKTRLRTRLPERLIAPGVFWLLIFWTSHTMGDQGPTRSPLDEICGARCVDFLLDFYDKPRPPLPELIRELSLPPHTSSGASLEDIQRALESRGVFTQAIHVNSGGRVLSKTPIVVHLQSNTFPEGHFCIWLPSSDDDSIHLWMASAGVTATVMPRTEFAKHFSGYALLTGLDSQGAKASLAHSWSYSLINTAAIAAMVFALVLSVVTYRKEVRQLISHAWK